MIKSLTNQRGFTLIELVTIIILIGIIVSIVSVNMSTTIETARVQQTISELRQLEYAISGNPESFSDGVRTDFGYIGDVGALPPNLDALVANPGGYSSWDGPYLTGGFNGTEYKKDAWNVDYTFTGISISSTGSGSSIDKEIAQNSSELLSNFVSGYIVDANNNSPGSVYKDSIRVELVYPNGTGGMTTSLVTPRKDGSFSYSGIPIGNHLLRVIFVPDSDTSSYQISIGKSSVANIDVTFPSDLW